MNRTRTRLLAALATVAVLVGGVAGGRHLLAGGGSPATSGAAAVPTAAAPTAVPTRAGTPPAGVMRTSSAAAGATAAGAPHKGAAAPGQDSALLDVPEFPVAPQVVHTATVDMRVGKGKLSSVLQDIATLAADDDGYVGSSSLSGGTTKSSPAAGTIVVRIPDSDFATAMAAVGGFGTVEDQHIKGQDVTVQVAQNAASIQVLQDEVNLLEQKLTQTSDIPTFLQIQSELFTVEQQLQRLQSAQAVLVNSAALATITVVLTAPGGPVAPGPVVAPRADAATMAWRYLRHNTLAVLDALAVVGGWALPVLILAALVGTAGWRLVRRRRHAITTA